MSEIKDGTEYNLTSDFQKESLETLFSDPIERTLEEDQGLLYLLSAVLHDLAYAERDTSYRNLYEYNIENPIVQNIVFNLYKGAIEPRLYQTKTSNRSLRKKIKAHTEE